MLDHKLKIRFNGNMTHEINEKVINLFTKNKTSKRTSKSDVIKEFAGFSYVRMDKDANGYDFKEKQLLSYAKKCHYIVKVMREKNGKPALYSYNVSSEKLLDFLLMFRNNELNGSIIEIDKFLPKNII